MFTCIKMKNFKSFKNVTIDFSKKKNACKPISIIYGINGSGKTTIAQAFYLLRHTIETMEIRGMLNDILNEKIAPPDNFPLKEDIMIKVLKRKLSMNGIETIIQKYKMIDTSDNMSVEYEFLINGNVGSYYIEFDNNSIVKECLEYKLNQRRGIYFNLEDEEILINNKIFETKEFYDLIKNQAKMYWGKHSLLSILLFEMNDKSDTFINSNISKNLMDVILLFTGIHYKTINTQECSSSDSILYNLQSGLINTSEEKVLNQVENILDEVFKFIYKDIIKVFYKKLYENDQISYRLFFKKKIEDKVFDIDFSLESSGTREILQLLPSFVEASSGKCVIIDEYGTRIHDVLSAKLLESVVDQITGQIILTTHNTMIMECTNLDADSLYFIIDDKTLKKSVKCITDLEERLHPNYNYRTRYLTQDMYKPSLPEMTEKIDLSGLVSLFK